MAVRAVDTYQNDRLAFPTVVAGTALGAGAGYAMKYILPVTKTENDFDKKAIVNSSRKIANHNMVEQLKVEAAKAQGIEKITKNTVLEFTPAKDLFIRIVKNKQGNQAFTPAGIAKSVAELNKKAPNAGNEYKALINTVNEAARVKSERLIKACKLMVKGERSLAGFLVPGAAVGFLTGMLVNVFRDNKEA